MNCQICGTATPSGVPLCPPCKAALKRARHETVQELKPLRRSQRRGGSQAARAAEAGALGAADLQPAPAPHGHRSRVPVVLAAALVALAVVHFGFVRPEAQAPAHAEASQPAPPPVAREAPAQVVESTKAPAVEPPALPASVVAPAPPLAPRPVVRPAPTAVSATPAARTIAPSAAAAESASAFGPEPVRAAPPPAAEPPAPRPAPAPPPDRRQVIASALARCGGNLFERSDCEERVRVQSCDGLWGQIPQCPMRLPAEFAR